MTRCIAGKIRRCTVNRCQNIHRRVQSWFQPRRATGVAARNRIENVGASVAGVPALHFQRPTPRFKAFTGQIYQNSHRFPSTRHKTRLTSRWTRPHPHCTGTIRGVPKSPAGPPVNSAAAAGGRKVHISVRHRSRGRREHTSLPPQRAAPRPTQENSPVMRFPL